MSIHHDDGEGQHPRPRRNTLERFNAELAVLDRPLESEIEYYEEPPRRSRRWLGTVVGLVGMLGSVAAFALTRHPNTAPSDVNAGADGARPRVAVVTPPPAAAPPVGSNAEPSSILSGIDPAVADRKANDAAGARPARSSAGSNMGFWRLQPSHRIWGSPGRAAVEPEPPARSQPHPHGLLHGSRHN